MKNIFFSLTFILLFTACHNNNKSTHEIKKDSVVVVKVNTPSNKPPIINITDTVSVKKLVICMKDSAANMDRITTKLTDIYSVKLAAVIKKNNLTVTGAPMAWYKTAKAPYFFEAGLPVDKKPAKLAAGVYIKNLESDSVVLAHFYGPYSMLNQAYDALSEWVSSHKKKMAGAPFEIYIDKATDKDGKLKDPYKIQTDIVFPWK